MDKDKEGVLGGKIHCKKLLTDLLEKTKVICTVCKAEFSYHRSNSFLTDHLKAKLLQECGAQANNNTCK